MEEARLLELEAMGGANRTRQRRAITELCAEVRRCRSTYTAKRVGELERDNARLSRSYGLLCDLLVSVWTRREIEEMYVDLGGEG